MQIVQSLKYLFEIGNKNTITAWVVPKKIIATKYIVCRKIYYGSLPFEWPWCYIV